MPAGRKADQERCPHDQPEDGHCWRRLGSHDQQERDGKQHDFDTQSSRISKSSGGARRDPASPQSRRRNRESDAEDRGAEQGAPTLPSPHAETDEHAKLSEEPDRQERLHRISVGTSGSVR